MGKPNICYYLGAGASYEALPIVNELPYELGTFKQYIINYNNSLGKSKVHDLEKLFTNFQTVINECFRHHSIDTIAKKHWLKNQNCKLNNEPIEYDWYQLVKNIISCWLTWRRLNLKQKLFEYDSKKKDIRLKDLKYLDPRYDAFFSAILNNNLQLPENIKMVSWNYDTQIEQSFSFYYPKESLKDVGNKIGLNYHSYEFGPIVKLNGSAIISLNQIPLWEKEYNENVHQYFISSLKNKFDPTSYSNIRFAWEKEGIVNNYRNLAKEYINKSSIIVVIGYSFPIFNREIDIELFSDFTKKGITKIYIQASELDAPRIKSQLESIESGLSEKAEIISNLNQFYLPNEFWNEMDINIEAFED
jgi:hypothetical protein